MPAGSGILTVLTADWCGSGRWSQAHIGHMRGISAVDVSDLMRLTFSAMAGGPLADRHGRVIVIDVCLPIIILLTFANLLMTGFWSFVLVRGAMNLTAALAVHQRR